jgi:hypothetical protein
VRALKLRDRASLDFEPIQISQPRGRIRVQELDGDASLELGIPSDPDGARSPAP